MRKVIFLAILTNDKMAIFATQNKITTACCHPSTMNSVLTTSN